MHYDSNIPIDIGNINFNLIFKPLGFTAPKKYDASIQHDHDHPYFEIHVPSRGNCTVCIEEEKYDLYENDILMIFPETFHYVSNSSDDFSTMVLSVEISKNKTGNVTDFYTDFFETLKKMPGFYLLRNCPSVSEHIKKVHECHYTHSALYDYIAPSRMLLFFSEFVLRFCKNIENKDIRLTTFAESTNRTQFIQFYLALHYAEDITLKKLANLMNLSEKHTNRTFNQLFGTTFSAYLTQIRLKNAKKLLRDSAHSLEDVAQFVGYKSYNGFYIAFKKQFGITPMDYRKKHFNK